MAHGLLIMHSENKTIPRQTVSVTRARAVFMEGNGGACRHEFSRWF